MLVPFQNSSTLLAFGFWSRITRVLVTVVIVTVVIVVITVIITPTLLSSSSATFAITSATFILATLATTIATAATTAITTTAFVAVPAPATVTTFSSTTTSRAISTISSHWLFCWLLLLRHRYMNLDATYLFSIHRFYARLCGIFTRETDKSQGSASSNVYVPNVAIFAKSFLELLLDSDNFIRFPILWNCDFHTEQVINIRQRHAYERGLRSRVPTTPHADP
mmetsp:Transcript_90677/g.143330  ORF Transcript_90677/g.143330 Transcript_90677/m.143330 type:complete len:223 (-) Transcript_90677:18-686(-)